MIIPVNIISGFLGSGKTTAITKLLNQKTSDENWVVIINEFGKISIDSHTIQSSSDAGTVFNISGGCICCSAKGYFQENLEKIVQSGNFVRIIIEPSGLGGIDMVSEIIEANSVLSLMPIICLVDIAGIENPRLQLNPIYGMQISKADIIVFSKCDLLTDLVMQSCLVDKFKSLYPNKLYCIIYSTEDLWLSLEGMSFIIREEKKSRLVYNMDSTLKDDNYQQESCLFGANTIFDPDRLTKFFIDNQFIVRAKGHVQTKNGWNLVNFTLSGCMFEPCAAKEFTEIIIINEKSGTNQNQSLNDKIQMSIY